MKNVKVRIKLGIGFSVLALLALIIGIVGIVSLNSLNSDYKAAVEIHGKPLADGAYMLEAIHSLRAEYRGIIIDIGNAENLQVRKTRIDDACENFERHLEAFHFSVIRPDVAKWMAQAEEQYFDILKPALYQGLQQAEDASSRDRLMQLMVNTMQPAADLVAANVKHTMETKSAMLDRTSAQSENLFWTVCVVLIVAVAVVAVFSVWMAVLFTRMITRPLEKMKSVAVQMGTTGNLDFSDAVKNDLLREGTAKDEFGQSIWAFNKFVEHVLYVAERLDGVARRDLSTDVQLLSPEDTMGNALQDMLSNLAADITALQKEKEKAQVASEAKGAFLSNMSHEIRTPLNAIVGMAAIGQNAAELEKKDYAFQKIQTASAHLLGVVSDVLDMSKIERNKFQLSYTTFEFEKMVRQVVDVVNFRVDEKRQKLLVYIDPAIPRMLLGDDQRLAQVITNLLANATKFTPEEGWIRFEAKLQSRDADACVLRMSVIDTGIGIAAEYLDKLFGAFEQGEVSTTRKYGGTGLGLVISKSIVEMMHGKIWVKSKPGEGAHFSFTARLKNAVGQEDVPHPKVSMDDVRVLLVCGDADVQKLFSEIVVRTGVVCDTASSGPQALLKLAENEPYHICFLDNDLPEMSAVELAGKMREVCGGASVVIMASAARWDAMEKEASAAGVTHHMSTPLFPSTLIDTINSCVGVPSKDGALASPDKESGLPAGDFSGHTLLVAEDIEINREIIAALLQDTGVAIECAENGTVAVFMFESDPAKYSLILMDIHMPEMDGYEATKAIRALPLPWAKEVPIVAMTANVFREDIERCIAVGMNEHTGKPVDPDALFAVLRKYLS